MANNSNDGKDNFLYPIGRYHGEFTPENLVFNANLQEFAQRASYVCSLESNGKISPKEAYHEIKRLWKQLKESKEALFDDAEHPDEEPPDS